MFIGKIESLINKVKELFVPKKQNNNQSQIVEKRQPMIKQLKKNK